MLADAGDPVLSDAEVRKQWDEAMTAALMPAPSISERYAALDYELTAIESSVRTAIAVFHSATPAAMRRIVCLRQTLDLLAFLDDHKTDPVLSKRIRELKKAEGRA